MRNPDAHLSDEELVLAADGELSAARAAEIRQHLAACWSCRARQRDLESAVADLVRLHRRTLDPLLPSAAAPRALLKAHLAGLSSGQPRGRHSWLQPLLGGTLAWRAVAVGALALACTLGIVSVYQRRWSGENRPVYAPSPRLTPGVARAVDREELCNSELPKNQVVTADMRRRVFQVYGISNADPQAYEVDYLITPALGGADDIRNLWPQPYVSTAWNARVKDALEDRLREMVCHGQLNLAEAQRDISTDWVAAYKKYFQTNEPQPAGR
jgi:anti-sigma factor RsiW